MSAALPDATRPATPTALRNARSALSPKAPAKAAFTAPISNLKTPSDALPDAPLPADPEPEPEPEPEVFARRLPRAPLLATSTALPNERSPEMSSSFSTSPAAATSAGGAIGAMRLISRPAAHPAEPLPAFTEIPLTPPQSPDEQALTVERVLTVHGEEIFGWMLASLSESDASDAFSLFSEDLWKSLARYDGRCSMRTWCYMLARHAVSRIARAGRVGPVGADRAVPLSQVRVSHMAAELRERTVEHLRSDVKARVRSLREHLSADDQTLLVLRVDKDLPWRDISLVFLGAEANEADLTRHAAGLRKRFERIKAKLRALVAHGEEGGASPA